MANTLLADNGVSSGTSGIKTTGDTSGQLALQTTTSGGTATTALTIDNNQNVGLGVTPSAWSGVGQVLEFGSGNYVFGTSAGQTQLGFNNYFNGSNYIYKNAGPAGRYQMVNSAGNLSHVWSNAGSGSAGGTITFTPALTLNSSGNLVFGTSNAGIIFDNSSASVNSTLNDYETGTFTPTWSANGSITYSTQYGYYTKIGNMVYCWIYLGTSAGSGNSGNLNVSNLPFASSVPANGVYAYPGYVGLNSLNNSYSTYQTLAVYSSSTVAFLYNSSGSVANGSALNGGGTSFSAFISYRASF
jgi:hypothetical protein